MKRIPPHWLVPLGLRGLILTLSVLTLISACGRKPVVKGIPFDMDKLFPPKSASSQESSRDKGIRLAKEKDFQAAVESFTKHVMEQPQNYSGFNALAVCYKNMGDHDNAMKNFERALEFTETPEDTAKVLANIGNLYFSADKPQVALGYYKEAAGLFDKNPLYLILIARTFITLDEYDRAGKVLEGAEKIHKALTHYEREDEKGLGYYLMAHCYAALDEPQKVLQHVENAVKANAARYVPKFRKDLTDQTSLLYTLSGNPGVEKILAKYSAGSEPLTGAKTR